MIKRLVVGTRGSELALLQTGWVVEKLKTIHQDIEITVKKITTAGDRLTKSSFAQIGSQGVFVKEIENSLLKGEIDLAVHSLKDLPCDVCSGLKIGAITQRDAVRDTLISVRGLKLDQLPQGSVIGTSSARRRGLLMAENRGFEVRECRGNLPTRIKKLQNGEFDAVILAEAGLARMNLTHLITEYLDVRRFVPAVGQGALCVEIRSDDAHLEELLKPINHEPTFRACMEERKFLGQIGGGCHAAVGGYAFVEDEYMAFIVFVGTKDGSWFARKEIRVPLDESNGLGFRMAKEILELPGVDAFLREVSCVSK